MFKLSLAFSNRSEIDNFVIAKARLLEIESRIDLCRFLSLLYEDGIKGTLFQGYGFHLFRKSKKHRGYVPLTNRQEICGLKRSIKAKDRALIYIHVHESLPTKSGPDKTCSIHGLQSRISTGLDGSSCNFDRSSSNSKNLTSQIKTRRQTRRHSMLHLEQNTSQTKDHSKSRSKFTPVTITKSFVVSKCRTSTTEPVASGINISISVSYTHLVGEDDCLIIEPLISADDLETMAHVYLKVMDANSEVVYSTFMDAAEVVSFRFIKVQLPASLIAVPSPLRIVITAAALTTASTRTGLSPLEGQLPIRARICEGSSLSAGVHHETCFNGPLLGCTSTKYPNCSRNSENDNCESVSDVADVDVSRSLTDMEADDLSAHILSDYDVLSSPDQASD